MYETTVEENLKGRVKCLEAHLRKAYDHLQAGRTISPNSSAHREFGITIGVIDPQSNKWGCLNV